MAEYQLEIKQLVTYPRCRIYREFIQTLIQDRSIRTHGGSGLFFYTVLCSYANFRTSYRRLYGVTYTVYPGEWIFSFSELMAWFRVRSKRAALAILDDLQERRLIRYTTQGKGRLIQYAITNWRAHNTVLDYNCPCQKETGFFFLPYSIVSGGSTFTGKFSEMDVLLDLWLSAVYRDDRIAGSELGPVVYFRDESLEPKLSYSQMSERWGLSRASVGRLLKKLAELGHISLMTFPGRHGTVIYLNNYLSTMFQVSDVRIDKYEVALALKIKLDAPDDIHAQECPVEELARLSHDTLFIVSKPFTTFVVEKFRSALAGQGVACFSCEKARYKLFPLSEDGRGNDRTGVFRFRLSVSCGKQSPTYYFDLVLSEPQHSAQEGDNEQ